MAEPYLAEIRIMSFAFPPQGWALCDGQLLPINQNQALFSLLGTTFGGDGRVNFGLPDLRGRTPIHVGASHTLGERGGEQAHTLAVAELPQHVHAMSGSATNADVVSPTDNVVAQTSQRYGPPAQLTALDASTNGSIGGSQAHLNMQPFLTLSFCIALSNAIFPSQS
jgi:microcystin-dependent protein